ncbi:Hsp20/alpha crystallin family protein [Mucilaginibacter terrae]|uniref:Hsp20/alpha crystallin family protein n=1 Tax=Mucilaginibacter terrae TaxID=1955052 RepID=UPI003640259A
MTLVKFNNAAIKHTVGPRFNEVFDSIFNDQYFNNTPAVKTPAVNIAEFESGFDIELAVPGLKKEDFKINLEKNLLTISAEATKEEVAGGKTYNRKEFSFSSFSRTFTLPETVDHSKIDAEYINGILKLTVAKKEEAKLQAREIAVK